MMKTKALFAAAASLCALAASAHAVPITITVTNNQAEGGLSLTPLYTAFHSAAFDAFNVGEAASAGVELIAEVGSPMDVAGERRAADPNSVGGVLTAPGGFGPAPVIEPGESTTLTFDVDPTSQRFFTFLSMILPTNDTFVGLDEAVEIFDEDGNFLGARSFDITSAFAYDAGTEVNTLLDGAAFVQGVDQTQGTVEGGVITAATDIGAIAGIIAANGIPLSAEAVAAFFGGGASLATITLDVAPVPVPGALILFGTAVAGAAGVRRRAAKAQA